MVRLSKTTSYRRSKRENKIYKCLRDDIRGLRDDGLTLRQIAAEMRKRNDRISHTTVRRILLNKGMKKHRKPYAPRSVPKELHPTVKILVDNLYAEENTRTTGEIIQLIKENLGVEVKPEVVASIREELGLRQSRVRYGHCVRLVNQLIRMIYCERKLEEGQQFLSHVFTDETYVQLGKNSRTCFVKNRYDSIKPAPKYVSKIMLWGGISVRGPCPIMLLRGKDSIVNSGRYQCILHDKYLEWSRSTFGPMAVLVQDWAPAHSSMSTRLYFQRSEITVEEWPPESADLNPVETVWALMKRWLTSYWKPKSIDHLEEGIHYWWNTHLTPELCTRLIERVQKKMREVLAHKGRPCPD